MPTARAKFGANPFIVSTVAVLIFVVAYLYDRYTPLGVAGGLIYIIFVVSGLWYRSSVFVFVFAAIGSIMTVVGYFTIEEMATGSRGVVQLNRAMSVAVLWFVATLGFYMKRGVVRSKAAESRLNAIIENTVEGIISIDYRGRIRSFNRACEKIFGFRAEEVIGENVKILMPAPYHDEHDGYIKNYHDTGQRKIIGIGREVEGKRKDGSVFPIDLSVNEVKVGDTVFYSGIVRDITEAKQARETLFEEKERLRIQLEKNVSLSSEIDHRKEAEEKIRIANAKLKRRTKELAETNEELSQFTFAVSHDLKTPLRAINGYSSWLADDLADNLQDDHKDYIDGMREAVGQAERLIDDLLDLSRIGRREEPAEGVRLTGFFRNLVDVINLDADIVIAEDLPEVNASPTLLTQIFQNLIINGITYNTSESKHIEIAHRVLDSDYEVFVRDNGIGIDPDFHKRVFQIFQRLHTREEFDGTGVGLAIVKKAAQQIGGGIRVESEPGAGSTFFVTIPHGGKIS